MDRLALIDGDILLYSCGFASDKKIYMVMDSDGEVLWEGKYKKEAKKRYEDLLLSHGGALCIDSRVEPEPVEYCLHSLKKTIESIEEGTGADSSFVVLSPEEETFRYDIATIQPYKENRKEQGKPYWYNEMRGLLFHVYEVQEAPHRLEADDLLAYLSKEESIKDEGIESVICSLDKDLDTVSGLHYNWRKGELYEVSEAEAMVNFYAQVLTGDRADNIPGLPGIGPVRAARLLQGCRDEEEIIDQVYGAYKDRGYGLEYLNEILDLLFIRRWEDESDPTGLQTWIDPGDRDREGYW